MRLLKTIISITLLLTYVLGFGHSLTPHCEINCNGLNEEKHLHEHHQHDGDDHLNSEHDHVEHGDHFDEGWVDYLVCLFSDVEHHGSNCHTHYVVSEENIQWNKSIEKNADQNNKSNIAVFVEYKLIGQKLTTTTNRVNGPPINFYRQTHLSSFTLRGPPIYSC